MRGRWFPSSGRRVSNGWDPERLRKGWIVTAEARHDIDGDGVEDLFVGVREGGNHALCWTCHALVYKRRDGAWHLAWERAYQTYGYPSKGACSFGFRDFDGDGREEFTVTVNVECFGNGGGGGCWVEKVYGWDSHGQPPAALMLEFPRKSFGTYWRGEDHYEEICARESIEDLDGDGRADVLVRYESKEVPTWDEAFYQTAASVVPAPARRLLREERWLRREEGFELDRAALLDSYHGLVGRARASGPEEGLSLCEQIESDFRKEQWAGEAIGLLGRIFEPRFDDLCFVRGELSLLAGRADRAFEEFESIAGWREVEGRIATRAAALLELGRICEDSFNAPREAAEYYAKALAHGATDANLPARIRALGAAAAQGSIRPLGLGEPEGVPPSQLRVASRAVIASNWQYLTTEAWMPDGRGILFCGRRAKGDTIGVYLASAPGEGTRRLCDGRFAVPYGRDGTILVAQEVETPEGKTGWRLGVTGTEGALVPWPGEPPSWIDGLGASPDGRHVVSIRSRCGAESFGYELSLAAPHAEPTVIRWRTGITSLCRIIGWRSDDELVVDLDEGTTVYDAAQDAWRKSDPARLGKGSYERRLSPSGTHVAYFGRDCRQAWGGFLWIARSDGSEQSQPDLGWRCRTAWGHGDVRWSPDGTRLMVVTAEPKEGHETTGHTLSVLVLGRRVAPVTSAHR